MKRGFYLKLAWSGIRKNRRLYTPYLLTCVGMVLMFYAVSYTHLDVYKRQILGFVFFFDTNHTIVPICCQFF